MFERRKRIGVKMQEVIAEQGESKRYLDIIDIQQGWRRRNRIISALEAHVVDEAYPPATVCASSLSCEDLDDSISASAHHPSTVFAPDN